jgi:hypothetical protein
MDNDNINKKLKELEYTRNILPQISNINEIYNNINKQSLSQTPQTPQQQIQYKNIENYPISINIPSEIQSKNNILYKNFIINSNNRDWFLNPDRNNIKCNITIDIKLNIIYPVCLCFPKKFKYITPYILMNISDGIKNIIYTFICKIQNDKWDIWIPSNKNIENISLNNQTWIISFYDFTNNLLELGNDNINIIKYEYIYDNNNDKNDNNDNNDKKYIKLILDIDYNNGNNIISNNGNGNGNGNGNNNIIIRTNNGLYINKIIKEIGEINNKCYIVILNDNKETKENKDINYNKSKILIMSEQYSCIIKYANL